MIQLNIKENCERVGIKNPHQLKLALGCHIDTATSLYHETLTRVDLDVLDKMVNVFKRPVHKILVKARDANSKGKQ